MERESHGTQMSSSKGWGGCWEGTAMMDKRQSRHLWEGPHWQSGLYVYFRLFLSYSWCITINAEECSLLELFKNKGGWGGGVVYTLHSFRKITLVLINAWDVPVLLINQRLSVQRHSLVMTKRTTRGLFSGIVCSPCGTQLSSVPEKLGEVLVSPRSAGGFF